MNSSIDGDGLSLNAFPVVDADDHAHLELLDDDDVGKRQRYLSRSHVGEALLGCAKSFARAVRGAYPCLVAD